MFDRNRRGWPALSGCALLGALFGVGCSGGESAGAVASVQEPLADQWNAWTGVNGTEAFVGSPGGCSTPDSGVLVLGRKSSNRYRLYMNKWRAFVNPAWTELGTQTFANKPACSSLDEDPAGIALASANQQFAILGRGTDNKLYARTMQADKTVSLVNGNPFVDPPTLKVDWHAINSNAHYASAPAAIVAYGKLLVVARRDDNRLYLHRNTLSTSLTNPYSSTGWSATLQVPALPSPWTAAGDPAIANTNPSGLGAIIVTRATAPGQADTLFQIYWQGVGTQSYFWDSAGSQDTWQFLPTGSYVRSDPSVVASASVSGGGVTVFVSGSATDPVTGPTQVYQGTGISWMWAPFQPIASQSLSFGSSPAGIVGDSERCYEVVGRSASNNAFYWSMEAPGTYNCP
jgi:hypothetical protein